MAEHSSTASTGRPALARVYGLRLFYQPRARARLVHATALLALVAYAYTSLRQIATLDGVNLKYDFLQFYAAASALNRGADPYAAFLSGCPGFHWCLGGYIYPPLLAEAMRPLALLSPRTAMRAWLVVSQVSLVAAMVITWRSLRSLVSPAAMSLLLVASLSFRPLQYTLYFGQVGLLLVLLLAVAGARYVARTDDAGSGAAMAVAAVLRVSPLLLLPAFWRRPRALAAALVSALSVLVGLTLLTPYTVEYFTHVLPRIGASTGILDNQAPQGVLLRAAILWGFPEPTGPLVSAAIAFAILAPTCWLGLRVGGDATRRATVFAAFVGAMPIVSSLTWHHHLVTELVAYSALLPALSAAPMALPRALAVGAYPLLWLDRHFTDTFTTLLGLAQPSGWRVALFLLVTGLNLAGMLLLWAAALVALRRLDARGLSGTR
ncbi:MAG: DUF2029 domain-containing protein [Candidatus Dormibacteraeota bacterium]|nr:DUF2029 domain-containing protein [Candidatus Dormibacteraeota bacterium]